MKKRTIYISLFLIFIIGVVSLIGTFAIDSTITEGTSNKADYLFNITLGDRTNREIVIPGYDSKIVDIKISNPNEFNMAYLLYLEGVNSNLSIINISDNEASGVLNSKTNTLIKVFIQNNSSSDITINIKDKVGFEKETLILPDNSTGINKENYYKAIVRSNNNTYGKVKENIKLSTLNGVVKYEISANTGYKYKSNTCNGTVSSNILTISNITSNINCEVVFEPNTYKIDYILNNGITGTNAPTTATYDSVVTINNPTKTVTVTGNANGTGATVGSATSKAQTFAGWTASNLNTSTAYYGTSSSAVSTKWSSASTKVTAQYFKNLTLTNGATVTLTANWTAVAFNLPTVTKTGYTCKWNTASDGSGTSYNSGASYTPSATGSTTVTMYAICTINKVHINYHVNGGTVTASTTSNSGTTYSWTTTDSIVYLNGTKLTTSINYGASTSSSGLPNYNNSKYLKITKTGYSALDGAEWICSSGCTTAGKTYDQDVAYASSDFCDTSNGDCTVVLKVNWQANTYTVSYNANGGSGSMSTDTVAYNTGYVTKKNGFTRTGYTFDGWNEKADGSGTSWTDWIGKSWTWTYTKNVTLYAQWKANTYTVSFNSNNLITGLSNVGTTNVTDMQYSVSNKVVTVTALKDDGYGFVNGRVYLEAGKTYIFSCTTNGTWGGGGDTVEAFLMLNGAYNVYYRMSSKNNYSFTPSTTGEYWLRLDVNKSGKTYTFSNISISTNISTKTLTYDGAYGTLPTSSRSNYTFIGWFSNTTSKYDSSKTYKDYPLYYYADTYSDLYNAFQYDQDKLFNHYNNNGKSEGRRISQYVSTDTFTGTSDTTLYAGWQPNTYTITYNLDGGTAGSSAPTSGTYGSTVTVSNPTRSGYTFTGWTVSGTGASMSGTSLTIGAGNVTLTANWGCK